MSHEAWAWGLLLLSSTAAGVLNALAGGGSFLTFPALLLAGVGPIEANATSAVSLWPGSLASAVGYRSALAGRATRLGLLWGLSLVGGAAGAVLLVYTPPGVFMNLVPFLLLIATLIFTFGDRLVLVRPGEQAGPMGGWALVAQLPIAVYGGYFGGGIGLMMLASFTLVGMRDLHQMNGLKSLLAAAINGAAIVAFIAAGTVAWRQAAVMIVGAVLGGYIGARVAQRAPVVWVRRVVVLLGWTLTLAFFWNRLSSKGAWS